MDPVGFWEKGEDKNGFSATRIYDIYIYVYEIKHISLSTTYVKMKENIFSYTILIQILMNQLYM